MPLVVNYVQYLFWIRGQINGCLALLPTTTTFPVWRWSKVTAHAANYLPLFCRGISFLDGTWLQKGIIISGKRIVQDTAVKVNQNQNLYLPIITLHRFFFRKLCFGGAPSMFIWAISQLVRTLKMKAARKILLLNTLVNVIEKFENRNSATYSWVVRL